MRDKSILIVDDEKRMADSMRDLLRAEGYTAMAAYDGAQAMERLQQVAFHLVITDLRMPGVTGLDLIRHIHEGYPHLAIVVATGHASTESAIEAMHCRVFDYLRKPYAFEMLRLTVEKAFQKIETDQLREDTAAMISHDIKAPLTSIIGFASMIHDRQNDEFHPRAADFAHMIEANGQKILELVENYLTTCRIEAGTLAFCPLPVDLRRMLDDILSMAMYSIGRQECEIVQDLEGVPARVRIDEGLVYRALSNLVTNALKYHIGDEPIRIVGRAIPAAETPLGAPSLRLSVENHSLPIAEAELAGIFDRFQRGASAGGIEGSGIGLYVVSAAVKAHGGRAGAEWIEPDSVRFFIELPMAAAIDDQPGQPELKASKKSGGHTAPLGSGAAGAEAMRTEI